MKNICILTQTYSNNRKELFNYHNKDVNDIYFRNKFKNMYVFHNCSAEYILELHNLDYFKKIDNIEYITYNNMTYTDTLRENLRLLKKQGFDYIIFIQDDCFSISDSQTIDNFYKMIQNNDFNMLNIECSFEKLQCDSEILVNESDLYLYKTSSDDFKKRGWWAFDDGPYIAKLDFIIDNLYDDNFFTKNNIWESEKYLNDKISPNKIERFTLSTALYYRFNIVGPNNNRELELNRLKEYIDIDE